MRTLGALTAVALGACLWLGGCADQLDINQRALVVGAAVDVAPPPNAYSVSVQFQQPTGGSQGGGSFLGGGGGASGGSQCRTVAGAGVDVADGVSQVNGKTDTVVYFGDLSVVAIGDRLARRGILAPLNYFLRLGETPESLQLVVARGDAASLFKGPCTTNGLAFSLFQYLSLAEHAAVPAAPNVMWRFLAATYSPSRASYVPLFAPAPSQHAAFHDLGDAIFVGGRMLGELTGYRSKVFDYLVKQGGFPNALIHVPGVRQRVAIRVRTVKRYLKVAGPREATLALEFNGYMREAPGLRIDDRDVAGLEADAARQLQAQVRSVLSQLQSWGADVLDIADYVHARDPQAVADWPAAFRHMKIHLQVKVDLRAGGRGL